MECQRATPRATPRAMPLCQVGILIELGVPHTLVQAVQVGVGMCITTLRRLSFRSAATDLSQASVEVSCGKVVRTYSTNLADHKDESGSSLQLLRYSQRYEPMAHSGC